MASPASAATVMPFEFGGYEKSEGVPFGDLEDRVFNSRCPPVVTPDTIIIAVCGPNDWGNNASPAADGWFFNDFYLFHHLFRGTAKKQYWMTCVDPGQIVNKYNELAHGNPSSDHRRVVLDKSMKDDVKDVLVFNGNDLLDRFLSYVADASKQVKNTERPILVLIFGHGIEDTYSITIGGTREYENCPYLTRPKFNEALLRHNPNPNVATLVSSCFGGGWIQTSYLNITAMAGVNEEDELLSRPQSLSMNRCCGSRYSTGVAKALIEMEIQDLNLKTDEGEELLQSPTFASLVATIHETLTQKVDVREKNYISFSAKDDEWGIEWRARTGFPLTSYLEKWESLRLIKSSGTTGTSQSGSVTLEDIINMSTSDAEFRVRRLALKYMKCKPGPDAAAKNHHVHGACNRLLRGQNDPLDPLDDLESLAGALKYRLITIMRLATEYKDRLKIPFPDCKDCDTYAYKGSVHENREKQKRFSPIYQMVAKANLFDGPGAGEGMPYYRGGDYLSMVFCESGWDMHRIQVALDGLARLRTKHGKFHRTVQTFKFWRDEETREIIGTLAKSTKKRLRTMSPSSKQAQAQTKIVGRSL